MHAWRDIPTASLNTEPARVKEARPSLGFFTSGTTGNPKPVLFSADDWQETTAHRAECLAALGVAAGDHAAVLLPFGPWFSGDNLTDALLSLGASVLPVGLYAPYLPAATRLMEETRVNVLVTTPSVAWLLSELPGQRQVERILLVGEAVPPMLRSALAKRFGASPRALFAASEAVLGFETGMAGVFRWNPDRIHLEVRDADGTVRDSGVGELLLTRRYGLAQPVLRYPLGDRAELLEDASGTRCFRYLGRHGHAFTLAGGVKITRAQIDHFLDTLGMPIHEAMFNLRHCAPRDQLLIELGASRPLPHPEKIRDRFVLSSIEIGDVAHGGLLELHVRVREAPSRAKRRLEITEAPWGL
nr:AMP-binding protein [Ectothiorhodospira sp. BSL-9]